VTAALGLLSFVEVVCIVVALLAAFALGTKQRRP
jgi:hypothetical protein